jgi:hypothetical protein
MKIYDIFKSEYVFIVEDYFTPNSFPADRVDFSSEYPDKGVPNKQQYTELRDTGCIYL